MDGYHFDFDIFSGLFTVGSGYAPTDISLRSSETHARTPLGQTVGFRQGSSMKPRLCQPATFVPKPTEDCQDRHTHPFRWHYAQTVLSCAGVQSRADRRWPSGAVCVGRGRVTEPMAKLPRKMCVVAKAAGVGDLADRLTRAKPLPTLQEARRMIQTKRVDIFIAD